MTHGGNQLYRAKDGTLYSGGYQYPARSTDNGSSWEQIKEDLTYSWYMGICGDGENIYTSCSNKDQPFFVSPETDGKAWKPLGDETFSAVAFEMVYDPANRILYSASWEEGLLALQLCQEHVGRGAARAAFRREQLHEHRRAAGKWRGLVERMAGRCGGKGRREDQQSFHLRPLWARASHPGP